MSFVINSKLQRKIAAERARARKIDALRTPQNLTSLFGAIPASTKPQSVRETRADLRRYIGATTDTQFRKYMRQNKLANTEAAYTHIANRRIKDVIQQNTNRVKQEKLAVTKRKVGNSIQQKLMLVETKLRFVNVQDDIRNSYGTLTLGDSAFRSYFMYIYDNVVEFPINNHIVESQRIARQYAANACRTSASAVTTALNSSRAGLRVYLVVTYMTNGVDPSTQDITSIGNLVSRNSGRTTLNSITEYNSFVKNSVVRMLDELNGLPYMEVIGIASIHINILRFTPSSWLGGSYQELPEFIMHTKSIINIKNTDDKCFLWCLIASRHMPTKNTERVKQYQKEEWINEWKFTDTTSLPMEIDKIRYFETKNNVSINIYTVDDDNKQKVKIPLRISKNKSAEIINLFYYKKHYSLIKNFSRFCGEGQYACPRCLKCYADKGCYKTHLNICQLLNENGSLCVMPKEREALNKVTGAKFTVKPTIQFDKYSMQKRQPVVLYADFESSLIPCNDHKMKGVSHKHEANSFRIHIESSIDLGIPLDYEYVGQEADYKFVSLLIQEIEPKILERLDILREQNNKPNLTASEESDFQKCTCCRFCKKDFKHDDIRVRDHCHYTGKYEGAAHQFCNVKATQSKTTIPVIFHNANYDIRCFISAFQKIKGNDFVHSISGLPCNMEIYKSLNINSFQIIDSYAHLTSSLDKLVKNLPANKKLRLRSIVKTDEEFALVCKKGLYPYEKIDCLGALDFPISELAPSDFDSKLCLSKISFEDWAHVQNVIKTFGFTTFRQYHDLYLKIDVLGLCDVFEYHRELSLGVYGLDPAHFIGLPQMTWQAGLKFTGVKLEQLTDQDMYTFFERAKRGGVSVISHKHAKANNEYLPDYDRTKESSFLLQLDCNNLYGWAMCERLPTHGFKWVDGDTLDEGFIRSYAADKTHTGYFLEVDLKYPDHLHNEHNDYPLAPEHLEIGMYRKLAPNLLNKNNYVVHISNLRYYLEKGMILTKIHRGVKFFHDTWLKAYIDNNSSLRQKATNDFEKDYYKLMNNAFYGKTMENVRGRINIQFCLSKERFDKYVSSPLFANQIHVINSEGLALVKCHRRTVNLDKPIYIGASVLDFSKLLMYKFHYDTMKVSYPNALMMKTDTDSLLYYIKTTDLYKELKTDNTLQSKIEYSNYPKHHPLFNTDRKKVPGYFQDECVDGKMAIISEYVGLRAKSYSNKLYYPEESDYHTKMKGKGVPNRHLKTRVTFDDYKTCLSTGKPVRLGDKASENETQRDPIYSFRSNGMCTYSVQSAKIALSSGDDKRIPISPGSVYTYAIGHYATR
jgi:hypothetical protein